MYLLLKYLLIAAVLKFSYSGTSKVDSSVKGSVWIGRSTPLKNGVVTLASDSLVVRMTRTNEKGYFSFHKLPKGNYRLLIMVTGYDKYTSGFFNLTTANPTRDFEDIELRPSTPSK